MRRLGIAAIALTLGACGAAPDPAPVAAAPTVAPESPPREAPIEPVSENCREMVKVVEKSGLIRPGTVSQEAAVLLTDSRWATKLDSHMQEGLAVCLSHYVAGGQNRWVRKLQLRNQLSGVVYATVEGDRFRIGE
jgi:uncharacterized lipoprotein YmbA